MKKFLLQLLGIPLVLVIANPSFAQFAAIKQIQTTTETRDPLTIYLTPGQGVTINYGKVEQTVETVWLDNKSFVGIDSDGCLSGINESCSKNEATALHLQLIAARPINMIENNNKSLLTVVTVDKQGVRHFFLYNIKPDYNLLAKDNTRLIEYMMASSNIARYDPNKLISNIKIAINRGLIRDAKLIDRVNKLTKLLQGGMAIEQAAKEAELSPRFIEGIGEQ